MEIATVHDLFGRPVTSAEDAERHSIWVAFLAFGSWLRVASIEVGFWHIESYLPAATVRCTIEEAYQATDASPRWGCASSSQARKLRRTDPFIANYRRHGFS